VNVLNNAYKFTPPNGRIWVSEEREAAEAVIRIRDTGIGISPEEQTRIFDMFSQVDSSKERSRGGLGIGLALVRKLIELHGGVVQVTSAGRGAGSEFVIRLPLVPEPVARDEHAEPAENAAQAVKTILVVDDNQDAAITLAALLELEGHHVSIANNGESAILTAVTEKPQLVILDIGMPRMNGLQVAEQIREQQHDPDPVLIALTGWDQPEDRRLSAEAGFDYHLVKPVDPAALRGIMDAIDRNGDAR
jgi:CheY-like chemotaxis protein